MAKVKLDILINLTIHGTPHNRRDDKGPAPDRVTGSLDEKAVVRDAARTLVIH